MAEDNTKLFIDKIEKLIVDGNKPVLKRLEKIEERLGNVEDGQKQLEDGQRQLEDGQRQLRGKLNEVENTLRKEIKQAYDFLSYDIGEVEKGINRIETKLDAHIKLPAHAA